ncbi:unnamed protein product [Cylindrotheca closterium]|uniref:Uncharacterized protein n=1 Tax=Cylindrotheca closterium TaxID=2856 RepID=A0AAD2CIB9_9STRA|nr:unnamed protein product [Cylindrotheca closterium]
MNLHSRVITTLFLSVSVWNLRIADSFQPKLPLRSSSFSLWHDDDCDKASITTLVRNNPKVAENHERRNDERNKRDDQSDVMESLDVVLERARKRKPSWVLKGVALWNSPFVVPWFLKSDLALATIAVFLGSYGFCVGYCLGKWMTNPQNQNRLRNFAAGDSSSSSSSSSDPFLETWQQALLFQYWPVFLAIVLDQAVSFLF